MFPADLSIPRFKGQILEVERLAMPPPSLAVHQVDNQPGTWVRDFCSGSAPRTPVNVLCGAPARAHVTLQGGLLPAL